MRTPRSLSSRVASGVKALCLLSMLMWAVACGGGGAAPPPSPLSAPTNLTYAIDPGFYRAGESIPANVPAVAGGTPTTWQAVPPLPTGLTLDPVDGTIAGTPAAEAGTTTHTITASNTAGQTQDAIDITVGVALPPAFLSLKEGFVAEVVLEPGAPSPAKIAKFALAPVNDDRIFYIEVDTGNVRVLHPDQGLLPTPFVTLNVLQGGHHGILGLTLAPDFASSGHVYVLACTPANVQQQTEDRIRVLRYTDANSVGTNETVVLDDLPIAPSGGVNNGGEILFGTDGHLYVSLGDVQDAGNSQVDAGTSLAGKVLRYDVSTGTGEVPGDNPFSDSPEWCRGLRNTFGLAVHPATGGLFGADNGPDADDKLNFLQAGKNFGWGGTPPPAEAGHTILTWQTVIVPTALCWHDGTTWGAGYADDLFLCAYDDHKIQRFQMSGSSFTDVDDQEDFAEFRLAASSNHPLDLCMAADGSLYVSTFSGIYRITKQ